MPTKETLFDKFSRNWQIVRPFFPNIDSNIKGFYDAVICPLCMTVLAREALYQSDDKKQLTIEHVPPESMGGKGRVLLCRDCNSNTGRKIDSVLLDFYNIRPFERKEPGSKIKVKGAVRSGDLKVSSNMEIQREGDGAFFIKLDVKDQYRKDQLKQFEGLSNYSIDFKGTMPSKKKTQIALLKIAYLLAFEKFGHCFILNGHYTGIREQIANPDKFIFPCFGVIDTKVIPLDPGFYFIQQPVDLRGLLVVFEVEHEGRKDKNAVLLPSPETNSYLYYLELFKYQGQDLKLSDYWRFNEKNYLTDPPYTGAFLLEFQKPYTVDIKSIGFF